LGQHLFLPHVYGVNHDCMVSSFDLPTLVAAEKQLDRRPAWHPEHCEFVVPLSVSGITVGGLELRGTGSFTALDRNIMFQLEHSPAGRKRIPLWRCEWRPFSPHTNKAIGPQELHFLQLPGSHEHPFYLNWLEHEQRMRTGNLPIAKEITPDPASFEEFLDFCGKQFNISNMNIVPAPEWRGDLFRV